MRMYVESNFLLEITRRQEESAHAQELLQLAWENRIDLAVPAFSLAESFWTQRKDSDKRKGYLGALSDEVTQLQRSHDRAHVTETAGTLIQQLRELEFDESLALDELVGEFCEVGRVLDLNAEVMQAARQIEMQTTLTIQDALVLASVTSDLTANPPPEHCAFVSRDRKAFQDANIIEFLNKRRCNYIPDFRNAVLFVRARLHS